MPHKRLVLDANILVCAVLGARARGLIERYSDSVAFNVAEAEYYLSTVLAPKRGSSEEVWQPTYDGVMTAVQVLAEDLNSP